MVGSEGMLGAHVVLGVAAAPQRALVQGAGRRWRIEWRALLRRARAQPAPCSAPSAATSTC